MLNHLIKGNGSKILFSLLLLVSLLQTKAERGKKAYYHFARIAHALSSKQLQKSLSSVLIPLGMGRQFSPIIHSNTPLILCCTLPSLHSAHCLRCHWLWRKQIDPFNSNTGVVIQKWQKRCIILPTCVNKVLAEVEFQQEGRGEEKFFY